MQWPLRLALMFTFSVALAQHRIIFSTSYALKNHIVHLKDGLRGDRQLDQGQRKLFACLTHILGMKMQIFGDSSNPGKLMPAYDYA